MFLGLALLIGGAAFFGVMASHRPSVGVSFSHSIAVPPSSQSPVVPIIETVMTYCHALTTDNISTAFDLLDADTQRLVTETGFDTQLDRSMFFRRGLRTCQVVDPIAVLHAIKANVFLTLTYGDNSQDKVAVGLLKENQQWKILFVPLVCTFSPGIQNLQDAPCCHIASLQMIFPPPCLT